MGDDTASTSVCICLSLYRLGIFVGFASFFFMEKTLRVLSGDEDGSGHSHSHSHSLGDETSTAKSSGVNGSVSQNGLRERGTSSKPTENGRQPEPTPTNGPSKLSAYLNLFGDFVHNMYAICYLPFVCFVNPPSQYGWLGVSTTHRSVGNLFRLAQPL